MNKEQRRKEWVEIIEALGEAFLALLRSEWAVLQKKWADSGKKLGVALALFALAGLLLALVVALAVVTTVLAVQHFAELQPWAATLWVMLAVLLLAAGLGAVGYLAFLRRFENPVVTARERFEDHLVWWRQSLLDASSALPRGEKNDERAEPREETPQEA